jgi:predicted transcriptional regulator
MKTQTIEIDDSTALVLERRTAERGVTVPELATIAVSPIEASVEEIVELDRRWAAVEAQDSVTSNDEVVRWLQTWGTPTFRSWRNR